MRRNQIRFTSQNHNELATQISKTGICIRSVICNIKNERQRREKILAYLHRGTKKQRGKVKIKNINTLKIYQ
ncbi:hypothetical protein CXF93_06300 [Moritella sp. Urea-trap-13]|nr:hypothetical protein CXF93_06300 [Moritella sp. Urea-trap-13]